MFPELILVVEAFCLQPCHKALCDDLRLGPSFRETAAGIGAGRGQLLRARRTFSMAMAVKISEVQARDLQLQAGALERPRDRKRERIVSAEEQQRKLTERPAGLCWAGPHHHEQLYVHIGKLQLLSFARFYLDDRRIARQRNQRVVLKGVV